MTATVKNTLLLLVIQTKAPLYKPKYQHMTVLFNTHETKRLPEKKSSTNWWYLSTLTAIAHQGQGSVHITVLEQTNEAINTRFLWKKKRNTTKKCNNTKSTYHEFQSIFSSFQAILLPTLHEKFSYLSNIITAWYNGISEGGATT
jgi:predicted methyltransferase